ncbi:recombination protein RecR [Thiothrix litoralis]|jgi:recombination protein RecR|uniref:Recombination protein RecR n=2 Tax=Thiothrix TaxID=1030 RepID=A0ABY9MSX1_9GAMM|nr:MULTISPECIES: recombination mediator RecR [Thiothrix]QTR44742.1 recombination protein RecR [Thiothrix litoralis]WML91537.1 recombination mediator RecR [Thiothrix lacustris]WMP16621.1 recombination mediator RecR [Thiothrix lacustris]
MSESSLLKELVDALRCLPGVGSRTAQRMAFHLLENDRRSGERLAAVMARAMRDVRHCSRCRTLTEHETCRICANPARQPNLLCVVEHPSDVVAVEQATGYRGYYFVLGGRLSPLDGIGPEDIGLDVLEARLDEGEVQELILATNPTVEGEVTAHYISELAAKRNIPASRIAHGVPMGSELEYVDSGTLSHAFEGRRKY